MEETIGKEMVRRFGGGGGPCVIDHKLMNPLHTSLDAAVHTHCSTDYIVKPASPSLTE